MRKLYHKTEAKKMKVSKQKLRTIIAEELEKISEGDNRGEGSMARHQLYRTAKLAMITRNMITDDTDLEEWVESKITKTHDYLKTVMDYIDNPDT